MRKDISTTTTTTVTKTHRAVISGDDLIAILRLHSPTSEIPASAEVFVMVPGGGDWSNMKLDLKQDASIELVWVESRKKELDEL